MKDVEIRKFRAEDVKEVFTDPAMLAGAELNEISGPGYTALSNGRIIGCGGVRIHGVGEVWAGFTPEARDMKKEMLYYNRIWLEHIIKENGLWLLFGRAEAETCGSKNFLRHFGFVPAENYFMRAESED